MDALLLWGLWCSKTKAWMIPLSALFLWSFMFFRILITALPEINKAPWKEKAEPEIC
jgi:hypothetical protein